MSDLQTPLLEARANVIKVSASVVAHAARLNAIKVEVASIKASILADAQIVNTGDFTAEQKAEGQAVITRCNDILDVM